MTSRLERKSFQEWFSGSYESSPPDSFLNRYCSSPSLPTSDRMSFSRDYVQPTSNIPRPTVQPRATRRMSGTCIPTARNVSRYTEKRPYTLESSLCADITNSNCDLHTQRTKCGFESMQTYQKNEPEVQPDSTISVGDVHSCLEGIQSTSYFKPRTLAGYIKYLEPMHLEGCLEKQSQKYLHRWKQRWFIMQTSQLIYYKSQADVAGKDENRRCGIIELDQVDSVTTAKEFGVGAFQIRCHNRKYILRAESKDSMQDWLFNFQRSIANIISVLLQSHAFGNRSFRRKRMEQSRDLKRRSARNSRSVSLDWHESSTISHMHSPSPSPRNRLSPSLSRSNIDPKSPLGMFQIDLLDEHDLNAETLNLSRHSCSHVCLTEENESSDEDQHATPAAYVPRYIRDRQKAEATSPPPTKSNSNETEEREFDRCLRSRSDSILEMTYTDAFSYSAGSECHGVTSLLGVRNRMEDVCCCIPDLNAYLETEYSERQAIYALYDGHSGVQAAMFSKERLISYICAHESFYNNVRIAFDDSFRRVDREFLKQAALENWSAGTTAAVVFVRGNTLLTANIGDCRAVVCYGDSALDVIEEQTPGRIDERERIEQLGGWVKEERELQISKLHSMDLRDPFIQEKAERIVRWVNIYRVNGELAVSRAIGDLEYKGEALGEYRFWAFPEGHDRKFHGDLIIPEPEFKEIELTLEVEFLILACDGLWDTITSEEAIRHVRERLRDGLTAELASLSLANLAIRSGSSDNVSVIVVRFQ